jgi:hypothetical protein
MTKQTGPSPKSQVIDDLSDLLKDANKAVDRKELQDLLMTEEDKRNNDNLQKFLSAIPAESRSNSFQPYLAMNSSSPLVQLMTRQIG